MLQKMGHAGGGIIIYPIQGEFAVDRTKIRDKIGAFSAKFRFRHHHHPQSVGQHGAKQGFIQFFVILFAHTAPPSRKKVLWGRMVAAAAATSSRVTARIWAAWVSGVLVWPLMAAVEK